MKFVYDVEASVKEKIEAIATKVYGADGADYTPKANKEIKIWKRSDLETFRSAWQRTNIP